MVSYSIISVLNLNKKENLDVERESNKQNRGMFQNGLYKMYFGNTITLVKTHVPSERYCHKDYGYSISIPVHSSDIIFENLIKAR